MSFKKQTVTVALLISTLIVAIFSVVASAFGWLTSVIPVCAALGLHVIYVCMYFHKKLKASKTGIEIEDDDDK